MEAAGLRRIFARFAEFESVHIDRQLKSWESLETEDHQRLMELYDQEILKNVRDPKEIYEAIERKTRGSKAYDYFVSAMRHLLLIRGENEENARYFQLVDSLISSIVLDRNPNFSNGLSSITGVSVARLVAQMGDQDHSQELEDELKTLRARIQSIEIEKEDLQSRLDRSADGLVGELVKRAEELEEKLKISRHNTEHLKNQILEQKKGYGEQVHQLEVQMSELFRMLREANGFEKLFTNASITDGERMSRQDMVSMLAKQLERQKTIGILEGKHKKKAGAKALPSVPDLGTKFSDSEDERVMDSEDTTITQKDSTRRRLQGRKAKTFNPLTGTEELSDEDEAKDDSGVAGDPTVRSLSCAIVLSLTCSV